MTQWCTYSKETEVLMIFFFLRLLGTSITRRSTLDCLSVWHFRKSAEWIKFCVAFLPSFSNFLKETQKKLTSPHTPPPPQPWVMNERECFICHDTISCTSKFRVPSQLWRHCWLTYPESTQARLREWGYKQHILIQLFLINGSAMMSFLMLLDRTFRSLYLFSRLDQH